MEHGHDSPLQIDVTWDGVVATVTATGELDITTATPLTRRLLAVAAQRPERLVLDLAGLVFVDVAGADSGCRAHAVANRMPGDHAPAAARKIFGITGLMKT